MKRFIGGFDYAVFTASDAAGGLEKSRAVSPDLTILGVAYILIRKILRPLRALKTGAEVLGAGRADHRVPQKGTR